MILYYIILYYIIFYIIYYIILYYIILYYIILYYIILYYIILSYTIFHYIILYCMVIGRSICLDSTCQLSWRSSAEICDCARQGGQKPPVSAKAWAELHLGVSKDHFIVWYSIV